MIAEGQVIEPSLTVYLNVDPIQAYERYLARNDPAEMMTTPPTEEDHSNSPVISKHLDKYIKLSRDSTPDPEEDIPGYTVNYFQDLQESYEEASKIVNTKIVKHDWNDDKPINFADNLLEDDMVIQFLHMVYRELHQFNLQELL